MLSKYGILLYKQKGLYEHYRRHNYMLYRTTVVVSMEVFNRYEMDDEGVVCRRIYIWWVGSYAFSGIRMIIMMMISKKNNYNCEFLRINQRSVRLLRRIDQLVDVVTLSW